MRIVHYHPFMLGGRGGTATAARGWLGAVQEAGATPVGVVDREFVHLPAPENVEVVPLRHVGAGPLSAPTGLGATVRDGDVLVLHGGWLLRNVVATAVAARRDVAVVVTAHGAYDPHVFASRSAAKAVWAAMLERRMLRRASAVHLFFDQELAGLERLGARVSTVVAPNGIDPAPARWDGGSGGYLLWLGRYAPRNKGLDLLVPAIASMPPDDRPRLRLHGLDWRGQRRTVEAEVRRLGLEAWVAVGGPIYGDEKWEAIARAAGFVYPSRWEACSVSVLESLSAGVPTLVAPYAMGRSLADDGAALLADWTTEDLARVLRRLTGPEATTIAKRAAEVAATRFAWPTVARSWLQQVEALRTRAEAA